MLSELSFLNLNLLLELSNPFLAKSLDLLRRAHERLLPGMDSLMLDLPRRLNKSLGATRVAATRVRLRILPCIRPLIGMLHLVGLEGLLRDQVLLADCRGAQDSAVGQRFLLLAFELIDVPLSDLLPRSALHLL